jgi:hypothetical protein
MANSIEISRTLELLGRLKWYDEDQCWYDVNGWYKYEHEEILDMFRAALQDWLEEKN